MTDKMNDFTRHEIPAIPASMTRRVLHMKGWFQKSIDNKCGHLDDMVFFK